MRGFGRVDRGGSISTPCMSLGSGNQAAIIAVDLVAGAEIATRLIASASKVSGLSEIGAVAGGQTDSMASWQMVADDGLNLAGAAG